MTENPLYCERLYMPRNVALLRVSLPLVLGIIGLQTRLWAFVVVAAISLLYNLLTLWAASRNVVVVDSSSLSLGPSRFPVASMVSLRILEKPELRSLTARGIGGAARNLAAKRTVYSPRYFTRGVYIGLTDAPYHEFVLATRHPEELFEAVRTSLEQAGARLTQTASHSWLIEASHSG